LAGDGGGDEGGTAFLEKVDAELDFLDDAGGFAVECREDGSLLRPVRDRDWNRSDVFPVCSWYLRTIVSRLDLLRDLVGEQPVLKLPRR